jgi:hypothetical protein
MLPFGVTIPATVPQGSKIPEGLMNNLVHAFFSLPQTNEKDGYISLLPFCTQAPFFVNEISSPLTLIIILHYCIVPLTIVSNLKMA